MDALTDPAREAGGSAPPAPTELEAIVERLQRRFPNAPEERVREAVVDASRRLTDARVTQYLPVLIERMARDELTRQETNP